MTKDIKDYIRTIPDFPHDGILFRDVTTLFSDPEGLRLTMQRLVDAAVDIEFDSVAGIEARGFIIGGSLAEKTGKCFVAIRKKGKLPGATITEDYDLEYGSASLEIHDDAFQPGEKVLLLDDLLATGGTAAAATKLIERLGAEVVQVSFVVDLPELGGRKALEAMGLTVHTLCEFEGL